MSKKLGDSLKLLLPSDSEYLNFTEKVYTESFITFLQIICPPFTLFFDLVNLIFLPTFAYFSFLILSNLISLMLTFVWQCHVTLLITTISYYIRCFRGFYLRLAYHFLRRLHGNCWLCWKAKQTCINLLASYT